MAKIIIGNVKGKDGRGITRIVKTASTGAVDTYTITYTDNTTSTFTINNSNSISLQRQIVPSAAVESSTTASQAYTAGDYVVVGEALRKVTSSITKGSAIGNSNSTATTVTGEIATALDSVPRRGKVSLTTKLNENIVQVTFDKPIAGDYVVVVTNEFVKGNQAWGWTVVVSMVYDKKASGFKIDVYAPSKEYTGIPMVLNWVAIPV